MTQLKLRDQYDWVVLGAHPGALLSASMIARLGLSVLVLPTGPSIHEGSSDSGHPLDLESNFILGLGRTDAVPGLVHHCLAKTGMLATEVQSIRTKEAVTAILTPSARLTVLGSEQGFERELRREFGERWAEESALQRHLKAAEGEVDQFWASFPTRYDLPEGAKKRPKAPSIQKQLDVLGRRLGSGFKGLKGHSPEVIEAFASLWMGVMGPNGQAPLRSELLHAISLTRTAGSFRGGIGAYRAFLLKLAQRLGAQVATDSRCAQIFVDGGKLVGVQVAQSSSMIAVDGGILGCSLEHARELVSTSGSRLFRRLKSSPTARGWKFTLALTVEAEALPGLAPRRAIWNEAGSPLLEIEHCDPAEYGHPIPHARLIFARTYLPFTSESLDPGYQRLIAARMFKQLTEIFPFIEYHVVKVHPDFRLESDRASAEIAACYPYKSLNELPETLRCYDEGVGSDSGVQGLFIGTGEAYPRLGSLSGSVAAIEAVAWLAARHGLKGPLG